MVGDLNLASVDSILHDVDIADAASVSLLNSDGGNTCAGVITPEPRVTHDNLQYQEGTEVVIFGLKTHASLNDCVGTIKGFRNGRFVIRMGREVNPPNCLVGDLKSIKPQNVASREKYMCLRAPVIKGQCWGCGTDEQSRFQVCGQCREDRLADPAAFCSKACFKDSWPRHKEWHEMQRQMKSVENRVMQTQQPTSVKKVLAVAAEEFGIRKEDLADLVKESGLTKSALKYSDLIDQGSAAGQANDFRTTLKLFRKASALFPDRHVAHYNLGYALQCSGSWVDAAAAYLHSAEMAPTGSEEWGMAVNGVYTTMKHPQCLAFAKPEWLTCPKKFARISEQVIQAAPRSNASWDMHGASLSGRHIRYISPGLGIECAQENLSSAAKSFQRAYVISGSQGHQEIRSTFV